MNSTPELDQLLERMWLDYCQLNPAAKRIYDLLTQAGEQVVNDHIALRTFEGEAMGVRQLGQIFERLGYQSRGEYNFEAKKLYAQHFEHPDPAQPKIFISELQFHKLSSATQDKIHKMLSEIPADFASRQDLFVLGRPWKMSSQDYLELAQESEYASWVAAHGFRPNHFTVSINHLQKFKNVVEINDYLKQQGYQLNSSGGEIKGSPEVYLEQSSTMASEIPVQFDDRELSIPGCYYEFALRYPEPKTGKLYQGFVTSSADKIFESTNQARS